MCSELLGPSTWLSAVRWTSHIAPFQTIRSVFSLCGQMAVRQSEFDTSWPETNTCDFSQAPPWQPARIDNSAQRRLMPSISYHRPTPSRMGVIGAKVGQEPQQPIEPAVLGPARAGALPRVARGVEE